MTKLDDKALREMLAVAQGRYGKHYAEDIRAGLTTTVWDDAALVAMAAVRDAALKEAADMLETERPCTHGFNPIATRPDVPMGWRSAAKAVRALVSTSSE